MLKKLKKLKILKQFFKILKILLKKTNTIRIYFLKDLCMDMSMRMCMYMCMRTCVYMYIRAGRALFQKGIMIVININYMIMHNSKKDL